MPKNGEEEEFFRISSSDEANSEEGSNNEDEDNGYVNNDQELTLQGEPTIDKKQVTLESLGVRFMEQDSLERKVAQDADKVMVARDIELDQKRLEKTRAKLKKFEVKLKSLQNKLQDTNTRISERERIKIEIGELQRVEIGPLLTDIKDITERLKDSQELEKKNKSMRTASDNTINSNPINDSEDNTVAQLPSETNQEFLIRTGKITAFGSANGFIHEDNKEELAHAPTHQNLIGPGLEEFEELNEEEEEEEENDDDDDEIQIIEDDDEDEDQEIIKSKTNPKTKSQRDDESEYEDDNEDFIDIAAESDDQDEEIEDDDDFIVSDDDYTGKKSKKKQQKSNKTKNNLSHSTSTLNADDEFKNIDDGDESVYQKRLAQWISKRSSLRQAKRPDYQDDDPNKPEWLKPHPTVNDAILNDQFKIPGDIYPSLFDYQKTCVQWLWELYSQKTGGILGDEMGLGKTVQVISFLAGLHYSGKLDKPVLIVCPATVLTQWCNEFHRWWPPLRTVILHSIGTGMAPSGNRKRKSSTWDDEQEDSLESLLAQDEEIGSSGNNFGIKVNKNAQQLVDKVVKMGNVIITTYVGVRIYSRYLLPVKWGYVVLDEGHKIRNPDSYITLTCKQLKTPNRIILSGTPIQNNLVELWSLFDFIFPGRLGTLPVFQRQFCIPINLGGYANATNVQVQTAYKCAVILRDLISPYLLRRVKADVAKDLPKKSEMVLFCKLTPQQMTLYQNFLESEDLKRILNGKRNALYGIDMLRKICNHPDLVDLSIKGKLKIPGASDGGGGRSKIQERSGKLQVVSMLLELWNKEKRKSLIFTQTKQMLNILQEFMDSLNKESNYEYQYLRMDGTTPIGQRQELVDTFNNDPKYSVFLLTTRVGGLGVNLTGASRVIIYDPDWNPSTDLQARERAWRLGQKKDVSIYRLMIAGSIEEKIYHRQIFKQFLTNKILKDPKQKRFFKMNDLYDLFTLGDQDTKGTETGDLFGASETNYDGIKERKSRFLQSRRMQHKQNSLTSNTGPEDDDLLMVSKLKGVSSLQKFEDGESDNDDDKDEKSGKKDKLDSDIMSSLFKNSGIHSALEHDSVMQQGGGGSGGNNSGGAATSYNMVENEANRIAADAVKALRQSRKLTKMTGIGVPTWTGKFGQAGKRTGTGTGGGIESGVDSKRRVVNAGNLSSILSKSSSPSLSPTPGSRISRQSSPVPASVPIPIPGSGSGSGIGLSSSSILANIQKRKQDTGKSFTNTSNTSNAKSNNNSKTSKKLDSSSTSFNSDLITKLSMYMSQIEDNFSTSSAVLDYLDIDVSNEKTVNVVRSMLRNICRWDKQRKGWVLNDEFR